MSLNTLTIAADTLSAFVSGIFAKAGCTRGEADRISIYLLAANLTGHDSHGVIRVPRYIQLMNDGLVHAGQKVQVVSDTPVLCVVDGQYGFGQTIAPQAVEIGIGKCKQMGLAAVALRHSGHIGRVGDWAEMAAKAGLVSIHFVNATGSALVAPFGSFERRFSTAPYCVGVPIPGRSPLILDFATSLVAEGKVLVASQGGKNIPSDALIGPDGEFSNDTRLLYGDFPTTGKRDILTGKGALRAFGHHKGSGLALMCELLGGALTGNGCPAPGKRFSNGMFSLYIDPARLDASEYFPEEVARYAEYVKSAKPAQAGDETLLPGEPEERMRTLRLAKGIPLAEETWASIVATARSLGVAAPGHA
ncbi:MAG: malate/lactate/ureidoglycolate dehydrogenase [Betaproteobacteria bacterium]|nr:malate/lactate/ureidoglycolate dehydrogenase [Betaproteobacteria bacterium]